MAGGTIQLVDNKRQLSNGTHLQDLYDGQQIKPKIMSYYCFILYIN